MDPNNLSNIFKTLMFIKNQCKKYEIESVVTSDQPLQLKIDMIKKKKDLYITQLTYTNELFSCIGYVIKNSGTLELL